MKINRNTLKQIIIQEMKNVRDTYDDEVVQRNKQSREKGIKDLIGEDGHSDVPSARRKLMTAVEDAGDILNNLDPEADTELPSWWMSKVTLAADYLNKARDYFLIGEQEDEEVLNADIPIENKIPALHGKVIDMLKKDGIEDGEIPGVIAAIANLNRETK
jgi:hypothetical protein